MSNTIKLSHSAISKFSDCNKSYELHYIKNVRSKYKDSSLYLGSAIDNALNYLLENFKKEDEDKLLAGALETFENQWTTQKNNLNEEVNLAYDENIRYSKYDFDPDLLERKDWHLIFKETEKPFEVRDKALNNPAECSVEELRINALMNWLCVKRKAELLIKAYYQDIMLPHYEEVLLVQKEFNINDGGNGVLRGFIDLVVKLKDGRVVVLDNKTSSVDYDPNSVKESVQLSIYKRVIQILREEGQISVPEVTHAGFAVVYKKLDKEITKICKSCGYKGLGSHKTCDNVIDGKRCGGEWEKTKKFSVKTDLIVDEIPTYMLNLVLENVDLVKRAIDTGIFPRNFNNCINRYGKKCDYFDLCRNNDDKDLVKLNKTEKTNG